MSEQNKERRILLSGLWLNEAQSGQKYFSGSLGVSGKLLVFKNSKKEKEQDPDYSLYLVPKAPKKDEEATADNQEAVPF